MLTIALTLAVATLLVRAFVWLIALASGDWQATGKARTSVLLPGAVAAGGALAWTNWLIDLGHTF